eukprot:40555-Chlamydomonas_euryale.AAC.13
MGARDVRARARRQRPDPCPRTFHASVQTPCQAGRATWTRRAALRGASSAREQPHSRFAGLLKAPSGEALTVRQAAGTAAKRRQVAFVAQADPAADVLVRSRRRVHCH